MAPTIPNLILISCPGSPTRKAPLVSSSQPPRNPSRISSEKAAIRGIFSTLAFIASLSASNWGELAAHPSPYIKIDGSILSIAARISFMVSISCIPIKSKRKPSMWYSLIQYKIDSIIYLRIMARSLAVSFPHPEPFAHCPSFVWR